LLFVNTFFFFWLPRVFHFHMHFRTSLSISF
jgi:hypothetical protein